jgi:hypothetical protein
MDVPPEVVDTTTGEVAVPVWARACRSYEAHRDHHRNTPDGWTCLACDGERGA